MEHNIWNKTANVVPNVVEAHPLRWKNISELLDMEKPFTILKQLHYLGLRQLSDIV